MFLCQYVLNMKLKNMHLSIPNSMEVNFRSHLLRPQRVLHPQQLILLIVPFQYDKRLKRFSYVSLVEKAWKKAWKPWFYHGFLAFPCYFHAFLFYKSTEKAWKAWYHII